MSEGEILLARRISELEGENARLRATESRIRDILSGFHGEYVATDIFLEALDVEPRDVMPVVVSDAVPPDTIFVVGQRFPNETEAEYAHRCGVLRMSPDPYHRPKSVARRGSVAGIGLDGKPTSTPRVVDDAENIVYGRSVEYPIGPPANYRGARVGDAFELPGRGKWFPPEGMFFKCGTHEGGMIRANALGQAYDEILCSVAKRESLIDPEVERIVYIFTEHCIEDLGDHYDGCAEGPAGFDFSELRKQYWDIEHARRYKPDGTSLTMGDIEKGYGIPPHPGSFGEFVIAHSSAFRAVAVVVEPDCVR